MNGFENSNNLGKSINSFGDALMIVDGTGERARAKSSHVGRRQFGLGIQAVRVGARKFQLKYVRRTIGELVGLLLLVIAHVHAGGQTGAQAGVQAVRPLRRL